MRFFQLNDRSDERHCLVVASDLDRARQLVRDVAMTFDGETNLRLDDAEAHGIALWVELDEAAARLSIRTSFDVHGRRQRPFVQADLADQFSTID